MTPAPAARMPFAERHIALAGADRRRVLDYLGIDPADGRGGVVAAALDPSLRTAPPDLPAPIAEAAVTAELAALTARNRPVKALIGLGFHASQTPAVIRRNVLENPSWYTAYTPYQPEISQGRLEVLMTFQTMCADLAGLPVACASLLDEASAAVEAANMLVRAARGRPARIAVDSQLLPATLAVLRNRAEPVGMELIDWDPAGTGPAPEGIAGAIVQYQGARGRLLDIEPVAAAVHAAGGRLAVAADPLALTVLRAPGEAGADVVFGSTGRFGLPLGYGGPHAAYLAARQDLLRQLPGRLVGLSKDADGAPALRLALQTREQHIRRERATSNICTAQVLPAVMAALYAMWHGPEGLAGMALEIHAQAGALAAALRAAGMEVALGFDMVYARVPGRAAELKAAARAAGYAIWQDGPDGLGIAFDETTGPADVAAVARALGAPERSAWAEAAAEARALADSQVAATEASVVAKALAASGAQIPPGLARTAPCLRHRVFHRYRTETAMMRYLRRLADRDYALDRGMIPLGSCTMKLNAAAEMETLGAATFADLHPFLDAADAAGALALIADLEAWLAQATGYDAVSLQPNAGSQGELAGLLAIRRYHAARGQGGRDICLIPASAHGTNAASAGLAGLRVVGVATAPDGSVDESDLASKLAEHGSQTAAIMLTYPSTHGVYEPGLRSVCAAAHAAGAQVYIDGANFNALVGWAKAGELGGDVSHLNLHKTFAMPHGGGGPGIGPVAAKAHLAPYLPGHPQAPEGRKDHPLTAAPFGSPLLLPIAWAYIHMMGAEGLAAATEGAVAGANYIARRLDHVFPVLYRGPGGFVAHECILDVRPLTARTGVSVDDVAKRLIDYGFHAPTMSFPVAGTLMVEPTESESLAELERFCAAMEAIAAEAESWAGAGLLAAAPHTALSVSDDEWSAPYPRRLAGYPAGPDPDRYWPPVRRVDGPYGDRHPVLTWPDEHDTPES